jgi:hypothetical protein
MSRHKGELSPLRVDREWPHQVMLRADDCLGQNYNLIADFCADLSLCPRGHSIVKDDEWQRVFCFAERNHAEKLWRDSAGSGLTRRNGVAVTVG